jgi:hypothetical protein
MSYIPQQTNYYSAFGELLIANVSPSIQIANPYSIDPANREDLEIFEATGGSADNSGNLFRCQSGTSLGGYGVIRSKGTVSYRAGEGILGRVTASFTTGVASSIQFAGLFSLTETCAFGYDGADFSIIHEYGGKAEVQTIQMTGTAADTVTVTLDGTAASGIAITNSDVQTNAAEIASALAGDSAVNGSWRFEQIDDKVICIAKAVGDKTDTMSIAFAGSATGTLTETTAGAAKTSNNVAQANWDNQPFTGFDPTQLNLYQVEFGYLGVANIKFSIYNPNTGLYEEVHSIKWANNYSVTNFGNPDLKIGWTAASLGSTGTNLTVTGGSGMGAIQGSETKERTTHSETASKAGITTTAQNVLTLKNRITYGDQFNLGSFSLVSISVDNDHNKGAVVQLLKNAVVAGTTNFQFHDEFNSIVVYDTSGSAATNGTLVDSFTVGPNSSTDNINLDYLDTTIAINTISGTATNNTVAFTWREEK